MFELQLEEKIQSGNKISFAFTDNISLSGMMIMSDTVLPIDSQLTIELSLKNSLKTIQVDGIVKWINSLGDDLYEAGIEIVNISKDDIQKLVDHFYRNVGEL